MIKFQVNVDCPPLYIDAILNIKVYCYWQDLCQKNLKKFEKQTSADILIPEFLLPNISIGPKNLLIVSTNLTSD